MNDELPATPTNRLTLDRLAVAFFLLATGCLFAGCCALFGIPGFFWFALS